MRGRVISTATAGVLLAVAAVAPALAGSRNAKHYSTTVTIKADQAAGLLTGQVKSDKKPCFKRRKVVINILGEDEGDDTTTSGGHYKFDFNGPIPPGTYDVRAPKLRVSKTVVCKPGVSKVVTLN